MSFYTGYDASATKAAAGNTIDPGLSPAVWKSAGADISEHNPSGYFHLQRWDTWIDLTTSTANDWVTSTVIATEGAAALTNGVTGAYGPVLELDTEGAADGDGIQLQFIKQGVTPVAGADIIFEARVAQADIATNPPDTFVGLASVDTTVITTAGGMTAADWAGFYTLASTDTIFGVEDGTQSVTAASTHTMLDYDTATVTSEAWVKLGFVLHGLSGTGNYYVNGVQGTQAVTFSAGPDAIVFPTLVCQTSSTAPDSRMYVHWYAVAQVPSSNATA